MQEGGLGWYGALIGGTLAVAVYSRIAKFSLGKFADAVAPGLFLGLAIGRIGCTLNGDSPGAETTLPWGLAYTNPAALVPADLLGVPTHPAPVYEILWIMVMLLVLWRLWKRLSPDGSLFLVSLVLYAVGRFIVSWSQGRGPGVGRAAAPVSRHFHRHLPVCRGDADCPQDAPGEAGGRAPRAARGAPGGGCTAAVVAGGRISARHSWQGRGVRTRPVSVSSGRRVNLTVTSTGRSPGC